MYIVKLRSKDTAVKRPKAFIPKKGKGLYKRDKKCFSLSIYHDCVFNYKI